MLSNCYFPQIIDESKTATPTKTSIPDSYEENIQFGTGLIKDSTGSAYFKYNGSYILTSVHGPTQKGSSTFIGNTGLLEVNVSYSPFTQSGDSLKLSSLIKDSLEESIRLELYSKSIITLNILILESSPFDLAAAINCGSLALIDSSIEIYDFAASLTIPIQPQTTSTPSLVDSTFLTVSFLQPRNQFVQFYLLGRIDPMVIETILEDLKLRCVQLRTRIMESYCHQ